MKRIALVLLAVTACSTTIVQTWKKPGLDRIDFRKVAVVAAVSDPATRRVIEDQLVSELGQTRAIASYMLAPGEIEREALKAALLQAGVDGAVAVRIVDVDRETRWVAGSYAYTYGYGYGFGYWPMYQPGYYTTDTHVQVETSIYDVAREELLFSSTSETVNPTSTRNLVDATLRSVRNELKKEGLLETPVARAARQRATTSRWLWTPSESETSHAPPSARPMVETKALPPSANSVSVVRSSAPRCANDMYGKAAASQLTSTPPLTRLTVARCAGRAGPVTFIARTLPWCETVTA
jgi:hypothetical protein